MCTSTVYTCMHEDGIDVQSSRLPASEAELCEPHKPASYHRDAFHHGMIMSCAHTPQAGSGHGTSSHGNQ